MPESERRYSGVKEYRAGKGAVLVETQRPDDVIKNANQVRVKVNGCSVRFSAWPFEPKHELA